MNSACTLECSWAVTEMHGCCCVLESTVTNNVVLPQQLSETHERGWNADDQRD